MTALPTDLADRDKPDVEAWNGADRHGDVKHLHTTDVDVDMKGMPPTNSTDEHIAGASGASCARSVAPPGAAWPPPASCSSFGCTAAASTGGLLARRSV